MNQSGLDSSGLLWNNNSKLTGFNQKVAKIGIDQHFTLNEDIEVNVQQCVTGRHFYNVSAETSRSP